MQRMCVRDPAGRGKHCYCVVVEDRSGIKSCCRCGKWNVQGTNWTRDEDFR